MHAKNVSQETICDLVKELAPIHSIFHALEPTNISMAKELWLDAARCGRYTSPSFGHHMEVIKSLAAPRIELCEKVARLISERTLEYPTTAVSFPAELEISQIFSDWAKDVENRFAILQSFSLGGGIYSRRAAIALMTAPSEVVVKSAHHSATAYRYRPPCTVRSTVEKPLFTYGTRQIVEALNRLLATTPFAHWSAHQSAIAHDFEVQGYCNTIIVPDNLILTEDQLDKQCSALINYQVRGIENVRALISEFIAPDDPLLQLLPEISQSANRTVAAGASVWAAVQLEMNRRGNGQCELPTPWATLAVDYALKGHNFADTAEMLMHQLTASGYPMDLALEFTWDLCTSLFLAANKCYDRKDPCIITGAHAAYSGWHHLNCLSPQEREFQLNFNSLSPERLHTLYLALIKAGHPISPRYPSLSLNFD